MKARLLVIGAGLLLGATSCMIGDGSASAPVAAPTTGPQRSATTSPTLLQCPSVGTQSTTGVVGLLGGVLSLGGTKVEIPLGAVLEPTLFQIVVPESPYMEVELHAVGLTTFLFQKPIHVTIDYSRCADDAIPADAQLQGVYIDGVTKAVLQQMGGTDDRDARRITFSTGHFSGYAVAY
jgi:hypothetical protein